jgi:hypothetical protein
LKAAEGTTHHAAFFISGGPMARTTATKAQAKAMDIVEISPPENETRDNYPLVVTLAATNSPDQLPQGAMTASQAREYIKRIQDQGFSILTAEVIQAGDVNGIFTVQIFYCLVKGQ